MARRTIQSAGVEIRESDLSLRTAQTGTTTYIAGFADEGPTDEVIGLGNISEFEQIYGTPKTPAERYFYHTARAALNSSGSLLVNRLPYGPDNGAGFGTSVSLLVYPSICWDRTYLSAGEYQTAFSGDTTNIIGRPKQFTVTPAEWLQIKSGRFIGSGSPAGRDQKVWSEYSTSDFITISSINHASIIIANKGQTTIDNQFNGYYTSIADNTNINPSEDFNAIIEALTVSQSALPATGTGGTLNGFVAQQYTSIPSSRFEFQLSATPESGTNPATNSISQVMEDRVVGYNIATREFDDTLNIGVFKLGPSTFSKESSNLNYLFEEGYNGSVGYYRQRNSENGGSAVNFSLQAEGEKSRNIEVLVNPYFSDQLNGVQLNTDGTPKRKVRVFTNALSAALSLSSIPPEVTGLPSNLLRGFNYRVGLSAANFAPPLSGAISIPTFNANSLRVATADNLIPLGNYGGVTIAEKTTGNIPLKLDRAFDRVRNDRKFDIDIMAEAGLGTIHTYQQTGTVAQKANGFDDTQTTTAIEALRTSNDLTDATARTAYTTIFNRFATFAGPVKDGGRGDILFIADPIRQLLVTGKNSKVQKDPNRNFYTDIYWPMRHQFSLANTSYATVYANWMSVYDNHTGLQTYVPSSGFAAAKMASTDASVGPWGAPAGFNRGIITDASDIAITPNQRQRDDLYTVNLNPVANFADQGNVIFGQKTLLKKPSAFDRVNVRRTFLYLEKITKKTMQFFLFENNTLFTRTRVINTLTPFFERVKADDGLYDFMLVCDERNNTPEVIDQNELVVDVYLKPVRTAEFILVNFAAVRTGTNFEEIVSN